MGNGFFGSTLNSTTAVFAFCNSMRGAIGEVAPINASAVSPALTKGIITWASGPLLGKAQEWPMAMAPILVEWANAKLGKSAKIMRVRRFI